MYYTYMIYQRLGTELVRAETDDDVVTVYAARQVDGVLTVLVVNLASTPQTRPLTIVGGRSSGSAETWLFDLGPGGEGGRHSARRYGHAAGGSVTCVIRYGLDGQRSACPGGIAISTSDARRRRPIAPAAGADQAAESHRRSPSWRRRQFPPAGTPAGNRRPEERGTTAAGPRP
jgi:hypothetical protein